MRKKLYQTRKLDLTEANDVCRSSEATMRQLKSIPSPDKSWPWRSNNDDAHHPRRPTHNDSREISTAPEMDRAGTTKINCRTSIAKLTLSIVWVRLILAFAYEVASLDINQPTPIKL